MVPASDPEGPTIRHVNPPALGAPPGYSQVVETRGSRLVFISGQTAVGPDGAVVGGNDIAAQAEQVFRNLSVALESVGGTAGNLAKMTVFLRDMSHLASYREARNRFFASVTPVAAPAITLVEVSKLYHHDFLIEIEAIAVL
jgi:enamine deaminase RidA (YjgF/YER057c/UK114 family)